MYAFLVFCMGGKEGNQMVNHAIEEKARWYVEVLGESPNYHGAICFKTFDAFDSNGLCASLLG